MVDATKERTRAFVRSYDYENGTGTIKDAKDGAEVIALALESLPEAVRNKLALSAAMNLVGTAGTAAIRDKEDPHKAMAEMLANLEADEVDFRDGTGVAMGGVLKQLGRALVELGLSYAKGPDGKNYTWDAAKSTQDGFVYSGGEGVAGAFASMKALWNIPEKREQDGTRVNKKGETVPKYRTVHESGRVLINKIKTVPEVQAKLASYSKTKDQPVLG